jgi:uncharacterized Zn finger protein
VSSRRYGGFPPPSRPRAVEGGLVARSARGDIGLLWWSRRFVEVLESFALGSRLTRGKNYARRGQVLSLEVVAGTVKATVQGSRRAPYRVQIGLAPFSELVWAKVEVVLAEQAIHSARLLAGEFPAELEQVFAAAGAPLFPQRASDLAMSCSCPDWEVPCKHLSATFYLLAERFDDDPFQILHWRGRDRAALLGRLRELRGGSGPVVADGSPPDVAGGQRSVGAMTALADVVHVGRQVDPADAAGFWTATALPPQPSHPDLPVDLVLRQLPVPGEAIGGARLVTALRPLYTRLAGSQQ